MWNEAYDKLSSTEKTELRRIANYLLSHTYLVRDIYRPDKEWTEPSPDYRLVSRHSDFLTGYFAVAGWRLEKDDHYGVISLINEYDHNRARIDQFTTLFLYTCRLIYEEGREQGDNLYIVRTETGAIIEKMRTLGLLPGGKSTQKERLEAQRFMAHHNIIQKTEASAWSPEGNSILILPSILSLVSNQGITSLMAELEEFKKDQGAAKTGREEDAS